MNETHDLPERREDAVRVTRQPVGVGRSAMMVLVGAVLAAPLASCGDGGTGPDGDVTISVPFDFQGDATEQTSLLVIGVNGEVRVRSTSLGEAFRVRGFRRVQSCSRIHAEELIGELEVRVISTGAELAVRTHQPSSPTPCSLVVDYEITVPERLFAGIVNVNGDVTVLGLHAGVSVTNVNGIVALEDVERDATVRLTNGTVTAEVEIDGDEEIDLLTVNGGIDLTIPTGTGAHLSASVVNGTITVRNLTLSNQVSTQTSLTGTLGSGEGRIILRTTNGNVSITGG